MKQGIIAISDPKHLIQKRRAYGIPTKFWIARKEAFPVGTPPTLIYEDKYRGLIAVEICDNPHSLFDSNDMLFKLVHRTVLRLKDDLLLLWEGSDIDYYSLNKKFLDIEDMTREQRDQLRFLNSRLVEFEKQLSKQFEWAAVNFPDHCTWANIHYILSKNDSDYSDDDDNILFVQDGNSDYDGHNWNHYLTHENGELEQHCWLYYDLWANSGLVWEDILRIEKLWVQFRINFDIDFNIYDNNILA